MRARLARSGLAVVLSLLAPRQAIGQQADTTAKPVSLITAFEDLRNLTGLSADGLRESIRKLLADPDFLNSVLETAVNGSRRPPLLENLKIRFATFEATESDASGL